MRRGSKRGFQFSFAWIFAIIIGAIVIFLAVYAATQLVNTKRIEQESIAGKQISILTNPLGTNLESAKTAKIVVRSETRIFNDCENKPFQTFGRQGISTSIKSSIGEEWRPVPGVKSSLNNKYIFSNSTIQANEEFYVLSKPLFFPYKIADLIIMWPDKKEYCFVRPPASMEQEIDDLDLENIQVKTSIGACNPRDIKVRFTNAPNHPDFDIIVNDNTKSVTHVSLGETVYYADSFGVDKNALQYAAIFSDPKTYECQIGRIKKRAIELAGLYNQKAVLINSLSTPRCHIGPIYSNALSLYRSKFSLLQTSEDLKTMRAAPFGEAYTLREINEKLVPCKQF